MCCILLSMFSCYAYASQDGGENYPSNKITISEEQNADSSLKSTPKSEDSKSLTEKQLQTDTGLDPKSGEQKTIEIKDENENTNTKESKSEVIKISPRNDTIKIEVIKGKENQDIISYQAAVAIGIPLIVLFVTNIVTLFKIRVESKAAIRNELSMNTIKLKKEQLSLFYDPIIALLHTNSEVFSAFGPRTFPEDPHSGEEALHIWDILVNKVILPNNSEIVTIIKRNTHLMFPEDNFDLYLRFMKHAVSYEAFRDTPNELHEEFLPNVKKYRDKALNDLRTIEMKLKK